MKRDAAGSVRNAKQDVVFFMLDQCSAVWIEQAPAKGIVDMPNVRRLRRMGTTFDRCYTSNPVCCPARATLATGLTTRQHGLLENGYALDPSLPTFMQALQRGGWRTGAFGKVHLHPHHAGLWPDYRPYGFDVQYNTEDPRGGMWLDWIRSEHPEHFDATLAAVWTKRIPDFRHYGNGEQLIDLASDPHEQHNLAGNHDCAHTRNQLRDMLTEQIIMQDYPKTRRGVFAFGVH